MASLLSFHPRPLLLTPSPSPSPSRPKAPHSLPSRANFGGPLPRSPLLSSRGDLVVARLGHGPLLPDLEAAEAIARELFGRAEGFVYTIADAAVNSDAATAATEGSKQNKDWLSGITNYMETVLKVLKDGLSTLHVPYAYGFAIILLTVLVKAATFPLTKKQVESALAMRSLQPQVKAIQERYAGNQERIQLETARVYKLAGVNPLAGCLPTLATIPVWIGLYRALSNVANEGLLTEGFFWIPSLSGPTTIAARQSGSGTSWLFPFVDGHPPLGWSDTFAYLVLPVLLVVSQYISAQIMQSSQGNDPSQKNSQALTKLLPLVVGYFALSVPSGLSLYWLTNNILSTAQQIWLQKLGGAKNPVRQFGHRTNETSDVQNSLSGAQKSVLDDVETKKAQSSQRVKADSGGLHPGERFKQLKEQEERRRKQREEEKRRAEEKKAIDTATMITEQQNQEIKRVETRTDQDVENNRAKVQSSTTGGLGHNGSPEAMGEEGTHETVQEEEVSDRHASAGDEAPVHDHLNRADTERDEA